MASVWVWRRSPDGFSRPLRVSGWRALPHLTADGVLHIVRKLEKTLAPYAGHRRDRPHVGEHPAVRADEPGIIRCRHHIDEVADGDDRAQRETFRHRPAGQPLHCAGSVGLQHARGMDREWPTV